MERLFNIDPQLIHDSILMAISIFVLFIILSYVLIEPVRKILNERKEKITNDLESASNLKNEASKLKEEYELKIKNINKESEKILSDSREKAIQNETKLLSEAKLKSNKIIEEAKKNSMLEYERLSESIKNEIVEVSTSIAEKIINEEIDSKKAKDLVDDSVDKLGDIKWQD